MITISNALKELGFDGGWKIKGGKITKWYSEKEQPSDEVIQAKLQELQAEYDSKQYQRDRLAEYPSIQESIHALLDGGDTLTELQAKRAEVKTKFPKPSE